MIGVVGDLHGDSCALAEILTRGKFQKGDLLIVLGDFGFIFRDTYGEDLFLDGFEANCGPTVAFLSGNHENHSAIARYPVEDWCSGKIHRIRKNIVHLMNGEIYDFGPGKKCFVMGGAYSIDRALRTERKWLRLDLRGNAPAFSVPLPGAPDSDAGMGITIDDRERCYRFAEDLYRILQPAVSSVFSDYYGEYCDLRYSSRDGKKIGQIRRIEGVLDLLSREEYAPFRSGFAERMAEVVPEARGSVARILLREGTWWPEELPSSADYRNASERLKASGMQVDYVLSHTMPREMILRYGRTPDPHDGELTGFLEWIMYECSFRHHYFGHWHDDSPIGDRHTAVFREIHILK